MSIIHKNDFRSHLPKVINLPKKAKKSEKKAIEPQEEVIVEETKPIEMVLPNKRRQNKKQQEETIVDNEISNENE